MWYMAYCSATGRTTAINNTYSAICHFCIGSTESLGTATIEFLVGSLCHTFELHVVDIAVPVLLSITDMGSLGIYLNNLKTRLIHACSGEFSNVTSIRDQPFLRWVHTFAPTIRKQNYDDFIGTSAIPMLTSSTICSSAPNCLR